MKDINEYKKLTLKEIEDVLSSEEFKDMFPIGMIRPGLYRLPGGGYTGEGGWNMFNKAMKKAAKNFKIEEND